MATQKFPRSRSSRLLGKPLALESFEPRHLMSACLLPSLTLALSKIVSSTPAITTPAVATPAINKNLTLTLCPSFVFSGQTVLFSQTSLAVQNGFDALATTYNLTAPTAGQIVQLGNANGVESYSMTLTAPGITAHLTVDVNGNPLTAPTNTNLTWTTFSTNDPTAAAGITTLASDLGLTAPSSSTKVLEVTQNGNSTFTVNLSSGKKGWFPRYTTITVDASGNPVGTDLNLPFNYLSTTIQNGLIAAEPAGTTLTSASTQNVFINTIDGTPTYTMVFGSGSSKTTVTVDQNGNLATLPSQTTTTLASVPSAAATELQTLATADGYTGTLPTTQSVAVFTTLQTITNPGITVYTIQLTLSNHRHITISVDSNGNPTVPPTNDNNWFHFFIFGW